MPGIPTSSTITSGRWRGDSLFGLGRASGLVDVHLDVLERRAEQGAESRIVVYQQQSHRSPRIECLRTVVIGN